MKPHPRIRKTIKWGGAAVTVLLVVVWIGSHFQAVGWVSPSGTAVFTSSGQFLVHHAPVKFGGVIPAGWLFQHNSNVFAWGFRWYKSGTNWMIGVPLWLCVVATAACVLAAWRLDTLARRRARLNLCPKCHYDRTGLAAYAKCPECGHST